MITWVVPSFHLNDSVSLAFNLLWLSITYFHFGFGWSIQIIEDLDLLPYNWYILHLWTKNFLHLIEQHKMHKQVIFILLILILLNFTKFSVCQTFCNIYTRSCLSTNSLLRFFLASSIRWKLSILFGVFLPLWWFAFPVLPVTGFLQSLNVSCCSFCLARKISSLYQIL